MVGMGFKGGDGCTSLVSVSQMCHKNKKERHILTISGFACTIPIAFLGLCVLPSTPDKCNSRFLSADEVRLAQERMASENREVRQPFTKSKVL